MVCVYRPANSGPEEVYRGDVQIIGQDNDLLAGRAIIWIVKGTPTTMRSPGMLQQTYAADASAAPGQAPPLIGETNSSIILQTMADTRRWLIQTRSAGLDQLSHGQACQAQSRSSL